MKIQLNKHLCGIMVGVMAACAAPMVAATSMQPETSVAILYEAKGEASINVKNTDDTVSLPYSKIEDIPEDKEQLVILTMPVARVEAGETQLARLLRQGWPAIKGSALEASNF